MGFFAGAEGFVVVTRCVNVVCTGFFTGVVGLTVDPEGFTAGFEVGFFVGGFLVVVMGLTGLIGFFVVTGVKIGLVTVPGVVVFLNGVVDVVFVVVTCLIGVHAVEGSGLDGLNVVTLVNTVEGVLSTFSLWTT